MNRRAQRIMMQLTADKQKLSVFIALFAVGLLIWGRLLLKEVPHTAVAEPRVSATTPADKEAGARAFKRDTVYVDLPDDVQRDLFALNAEHYPKPIKTVDVPQVEAKSPPLRSDEEVLMARLKSALETLKLETTIMGRVPIAVINGQAIQKGQTIRGFELVEIRTRSVVLRMHDITVVLEL